VCIFLRWYYKQAFALYGRPSCPAGVWQEARSALPVMVGQTGQGTFTAAPERDQSRCPPSGRKARFHHPGKKMSSRFRRYGSARAEHFFDFSRARFLATDRPNQHSKLANKGRWCDRIKSAASIGMRGAAGKSLNALQHLLIHDLTTKSDKIRSLTVEPPACRSHTFLKYSVTRRELVNTGCGACGERYKRERMRRGQRTFCQSANFRLSICDRC